MHFTMDLKDVPPNNWTTTHPFIIILAVNDDVQFLLGPNGDLK